MTSANRRSTSSFSLAGTAVTVLALLLAAASCGSAGDDSVEATTKDPGSEPADTEASTIEGTWSIDSLDDNGSLEAPLEGTEPTIAFESDGTLSAYAGCNSIDSSWTLEGTTLDIGVPRQTMMACMEPAGVMEQEAALGAVLERVAGFALTDGLTLFDDEGQVLLTASPASR